jgi:hypothetical protein
MSNELSDTRSDAPLAHFCVQAIDHFYALYSENGVMLAVLDTRSASKLTALKDTPMIRFEAVLHSSVFTKRQRRNTKQSQSFPVSINIFGPESAADEAACRLSEVHAYLQHPESLLPEVKYHNPQFLTFANEDLNMSALIGTVNNSGQDLQINVAEEISRLLESLTDVAIGASLESPVGLISKLKK